MDIIENILDHLSDKSFPIVHLIDGKWGSGKTYYIKNTLIKILEKAYNQHTYYLSLYGVNSLDNFKDKLISTYSMNNTNFSTLVKSSSNIIDGVSQIAGKRGASAVISGISNLIKQTIYSNINDCIFIFDDLERCDVSDSILAESLHFAENKNIKIILVANFEQLKSKEFAEKTIAGKTTFSFTKTDIVNIVSDEYNLPEFIRETIESTITELDCTNIRTIKRAISKYKRIIRELSKVENINYELSQKIIMNQIIRCCHAIYDHQLSLSEIDSVLSSRIFSSHLQNHNENNDKNEEDLKAKRIEKIFPDCYNVNADAIRFCETGEFAFKDLISDFNLPRESSLLDVIINKRNLIKLDDEKYNNAIVELSGYIQKPVNVNLFKWFTYCDIAYHYSDLGYISDSYIKKQDIINYANKLDFDNIDKETLEYDGYPRNFFSNEIKELYNEKMRKFSSIISLKDNNIFIDKYKASWKNIEDTAENELMHTPLLSKIGYTNIIYGLQNWQPDDIYSFTIHLHKKYNFSNIDEYFYADHSIMKFLELYLLNHYQCAEPKKLGTINELRNKLVEINSRMNYRLNPSV